MKIFTLVFALVLVKKKFFIVLGEVDVATVSNNILVSV